MVVYVMVVGMGDVTPPVVIPVTLNVLGIVTGPRRVVVVPVLPSCNVSVVRLVPMVKDEPGIPLMVEDCNVVTLVVAIYSNGRKIKCINSMSEVELYSIQSKFNQAKTEYVTLLETIQTSCLGNQMSKECQKAASLNADMQTYLIQMSSLVKKTSTSLPKQKELLDISNQLGGDMENLASLEKEEEDGQVVASMNYIHALAWSIAGVAIVCIVVQQTRK